MRTALDRVVCISAGDLDPETAAMANGRPRRFELGIGGHHEGNQITLVGTSSATSFRSTPWPTMRTFAKSSRHMGKTYTASVSTSSISWLKSRISCTRLGGTSPRKQLFWTRYRPEFRACGKKGVRPLEFRGSD